MKQSEKNLSVIQNFILFLTHCSHPKDGADPNFKEVQEWTPELMYEMAEAYIAEDHVDGEDFEEDEFTGTPETEADYAVVDKVLKQIKEDVEDEDMTAVCELLMFSEMRYLTGYLPENLDV